MHFYNFRSSIFQIHKLTWNVPDILNSILNGAQPWHTHSKPYCVFLYSQFHSFSLSCSHFALSTAMDSSGLSGSGGVRGRAGCLNVSARRVDIRVLTFENLISDLIPLQLHLISPSLHQTPCSPSPQMRRDRWATYWNFAPPKTSRQTA